MKGKFWRKALAAALALLIVSGGVPMQPFTQIPESTVITANAAEYTQNPTTKDELVPLASSSSVSEAHVVKYANKEWYVIGYDGVGLASESGTMTLLLKGTLGRREFSDNCSNVYADSSIHSYLESYLANTDNFTSDESGAVVARTLSGGGSTGNSYSGHVSGDSVDAKLWLLSAAEARKIPQSIIKSGGDGNGWWLRSPGNSSSKANYILVSPPDMNDYPKDSGADVLYDKYIRPAMLLDLDSVIYSSETNTLIAQEAEAHGITVSLDNEQGSVEAPSRADKGETVRFTITPAVGYAVDTVTFNDISLSPVNGEYSFTMPNSDVTISVTFNQIYKVEDHLEQDGNTYTIKTAKGWEVFCDCVKSGAYNGFWNKTVKLGLDITDGVTVSAGIPGKPFYGTFDGCGHTLAVALNSTDEEWVAPFSFFNGSIKNLTVTGTVTGSTYAGGLTGFTYGGSIENVTVSADVSGSSKIGGITGYCDFGSLLIKNTIFNGSLQCEGDINGLIGWASENVGYNQAISIENCLFNGEYTCDGEFHPITIRNSNSQFKYTDNGAYYTVDPNLSSNSYIICAGTHVSTIAADDDLTITANPTCKFNSVDYYAEGTAVTVSSDESITGVLVNNGSVEVTDNQDGTYSFAMPAENVTINAIFTHSICINNTIQHGSVTANIGTTENVTAAPAGDSVTLIVTPDTGYTTKSVSVNGTAIEPVEGVYSFTMPDNDVTVTAEFEAITYSVAFNKNSNDATGSMDNQSFTGGTAQALTANGFTAPTGYHFAGWATSANGAVEYADGAEVSNLTAVNNDTVTLYAKWEANKHTVTYKVDGEVYGAVDTVAYGTALTAREAPTKTGYTFSGWSEIPATMPDEDVVITGSFIINKYAVTWKNGDTTLETDTNVPYGTAPSYDGATPTKAATAQYSYTFSGWSDGTNTYAAGALPTVSGNVTYTAQFNSTAKTYTITYKVDGEVYDTKTVSYGDSIALIDAPTREGYTFSGWQTSYTTMPASNIEITGTFAINTYAVTYMVDGAQYGDSATVEHGTKLTAPEAPTKNGAIFLGWTADGVNAYDFETPVTAETTLTAMWLDASGFITFSEGYAVTDDTYNGTDRDYVGFRFAVNMDNSNYTVVQHGILYGMNIAAFSDGKADANLRFTDEEATALMDKVREFAAQNTDTETTDWIEVYIGDRRDGVVYARGFIIVTDGTNNYLIYSDVQEGSYNSFSE